MFSLLKRRAFLVVLGLLLLAVFIWYAGPYFAFADFHPLETETARLIAIALVVACWLASVLLKRLRAYRASDKLVAAVVKQSQTEQGRPSAEALQLRERFEEAAATLKQKRRSGHSLYDLPWYVIIGAPGSGKTTALVNSGLKFPLEQRSGRAALRGVGGTRNCDWWFTDEAVFLDTAGRYTTQDSDAASDSAGWAEFLSLLRKYRTRRPVNGVILTISAQDLMVQGHAGREAHVAAARRRLEELSRELRIQLPVYLMVTKTDLVAGFTEYFDDLAQEGRAQVWGVTFPYEQTLAGEAARVFPEEFDALITRLNERLFARLAEEHDVRHRAKTFAFPQQMAGLRDLLAQFVTDVFASTRFDNQILLRGVYFTSGTQEGTPIDRLLGAIGKRFGVASEAVAPAGRGKAYFIERLLKEVMFAESGLAGVNRRVELQKAALQLGAYAAIALVVVVGVIAWSVSYGRNETYLAQVNADIAQLRQVPPVAASASLEAVLPRLDAVRAVVDSANRYRDDTPWAMRWGLYQGTSVGNAARDGYLRELDGTLLPHVAERIRQRLIAYGSEPDKLYEYLKAYLMLGEPEHLDKAQLAYIADLEWKSSASPAVADALSRHFNGLLETEGGLRPLVLDQSVIAQARSTIRQASIPGLMYRQLALTYAGDGARALRLDVAAGVGADHVLHRKSGVPLSQPVPSLYTAAVFKEVTGRGTTDVVKLYAADQWVWGEGALPPTRSATLAADVIAVYEKDYIATWDGIVKDIEPVPMPTLDSSKDALATLSGATSPLRGLLKTVDDNTFLVKPRDESQPSGVIPSAKKRLDDLFSAGEQAVGISTVVPGTEITTHFAPIHQLVAGTPGAAPIDALLHQLEQVQQKLSLVGSGVGQLSPADAGTMASVGDMLNALKHDAARLPPGVGTIVTQIADRTAAVSRSGLRGTLENRYQQDVVRACTEIIADRYPFIARSAADVPLADFGRLFGYGGVFEAFFKSELEPLVDTTRGPWRWRADASGASVGGGLPLSQFEAAQRIREMFFRQGSQVPEVHFTVMPVDLDAAATRFLLEFDGQPFDYRHGPEHRWPAVWPGPTPGMAAATFEDRSGAEPNKLFQGPWAWFRLLDFAQTQRESDVSYLLSFQMGGHQAHVRVEAASIRNPYASRDLQQFHCGS